MNVYDKARDLFAQRNDLVTFKAECDKLALECDELALECDELSETTLDVSEARNLSSLRLSLLDASGAAGALIEATRQIEMKACCESGSVPLK